jgi:hypothetical protein
MQQERNPKPHNGSRSFTPRAGSCGGGASHEAHAPVPLPRASAGRLALLLQAHVLALQHRQQRLAALQDL